MSLTISDGTYRQIQDISCFYKLTLELDDLADGMQAASFGYCSLKRGSGSSVRRWGELPQGLRNASYVVTRPLVIKPNSSASNFGDVELFGCAVSSDTRTRDLRFRSIPGDGGGQVAAAPGKRDRLFLHGPRLA
jgi:hypothetical protein